MGWLVERLVDPQSLILLAGLREPLCTPQQTIDRGASQICTRERGLKHVYCLRTSQLAQGCRRSKDRGGVLIFD